MQNKQFKVPKTVIGPYEVVILLPNCGSFLRKK